MFNDFALSSVGNNIGLYPLKNNAFNWTGADDRFGRYVLIGGKTPGLDQGKWLHLLIGGVYRNRKRKFDPMRTLVMGDIHGAYPAMLQCLERSGFDYEKDTLIQLGDIVDGHPQVYECVEELLRIKNLIAIRGNHDDWFKDYLKTGFHPDQWRQGGAATALSYLKSTGKRERIVQTEAGYKVALNPADVPPAHQVLFQEQHLYYIDENNNLFVHAGFDRRLPFKGQRSEIYYWDRTLWYAALSYNTGGHHPGTFKMETPFSTVFIGHTQTTAWQTDQPMHAANIWNLDTGAGFNGRLTIMEVETKEYWQSDPVTLWYDGLNRNE